MAAARATGMSSPKYYHDRVTGDLQREIAWTIANKMRDPRIPSLVSVTAVNLSDDTRNATVLVSVYAGEEEKEKALKALNGAAPFIQNTVAQRVKIKHFPRLYFKIDRGLENSRRINELLDDIKADLV